MTEDFVGFAFAGFVLACWWWQEHGRPRLDARRKARAECARFGHQWDAPFAAMGTLMRNCKRCKRQEHYHPESDSWH